MIFESGQSSAQITITPLQDDVIEDIEFVILSLTGGVNSYNVGCPDAALVAILDKSADMVETPREKVIYDFKLEKNFPNPFNSATQILFHLSAGQNVSLKIYDVVGRHVSTLLEGEFESGIHQVQWNGTNMMDQMVSTGIYFARLSSGDYSRTIKVLLQR